MGFQLGLQKGDEFTFAGKVSEVVERPGKQFRRNHDLELRVFVLEQNEKWTDAAVMTRLKRTDDVVTGAAGTLTGSGQKAVPPLIKLDIVRVHAAGTVHLLAPIGPPPLRLDANTPAQAMPLLPLETYAASEFGVFPPRPPRGNTGDPWAVATGPTRPDETWQAQKFEFLNAERCQYLVMNQQSPDWLKPVGGQTAWHRAESVLVSTQDGTARKVHRVIKQRDGRTTNPAAWVEVKYELQEQTRLNARTFDRARREIEVAYVAMVEAPTLSNQKQIEARLSKLDLTLSESGPSGTYREALLAARMLLEAAKRGEVIPAHATGAPIPAPARPHWPEPGEPAPDLQSSSFRLDDHKGKPVVLMFFKPGGETTELALAVADALDKRYSGKVAVVPLVVFGEVAAAEKDRNRLKLSVPLYDGAPVAAHFGVETVPRFAVIGADRKIRWTFTGIGFETGFLVKEQLDRLVAPASPASLSGTNRPTGPISLPPILRP